MSNGNSYILGEKRNMEPPLLYPPIIPNKN
jgi:hypothetical protein